ncbi:hypothetical protein BGZ60DRAFT_125835 [Tricladium varicosporioides]|nr:hypothetical protein BGZ60DRAFT_125835 [Hymenoscyphus varicosporioides]
MFMRIILIVLFHFSQSRLMTSGMEKLKWVTCKSSDSGSIPTVIHVAFLGTISSDARSIASPDFPRFHSSTGSHNLHYKCSDWRWRNCREIVISDGSFRCWNCQVLSVRDLISHDRSSSSVASLLVYPPFERRYNPRYWSRHLQKSLTLLASKQENINRPLICAGWRLLSIRFKPLLHRHFQILASGTRNSRKEVLPPSLRACSLPRTPQSALPPLHLLSKIYIPDIRVAPLFLFPER